MMCAIRRWLCVVMFVVPGIVPVSQVLSAEPLPPLKLLFLGDNGHHRPGDRFAQLAPVLAARQIELKYHDDPSVALTAETLSAFDGLVLYANHDSITPAQEQALLDFVAQGKGFIPLHCASYCFRNSPKFIELVGGQFQKHGGQVIAVEPLVAEHPILRGYSSFSSWDETYIHTKHNDKDRVVLEVRRQGDQAPGRTEEPWTWIRTHGQGRVFYTAWGHDQRTFGNPGFHNLVERGIRWACGQDPQLVPSYAGDVRFVPLAMTPIAKDLKPFDYVDVGPKIPNYQPGKPGQAFSKMQQPVPAAESMKHYSIPVGFKLELFASEPELGGKPIAMNWDERGRLWVCETYDYPNELQPRGEGRDRIRICEDTNGDGRADKFTVFAEQLSIPTAIVFTHGGVLVQDGSETLFLKDTNGDDRADVRTVVIRGWAMGDTHGGVSNFQYGLDNWFWAMQGYNNSAPEYGDGQKSPSFRMGFFRFAVDGQGKSGPQVTAVEFLRSTNNNTWGLGLSEEGLVFGSTANHNPSVFMPIPNRYYERVRGWAAEQLGTIADTHLFKAITDRIRQVDQFGGYTAGAGHALYTARTYPRQFWNRTAFVTEPTGHLVGTFTLEPQGTTFQATSPMNLVASDDEWAAPIMAEVGPDGNVWVLDWYNYIVQHNPTPQGFKTGKGNAYESDLRDKKYGRIYRVVAPPNPSRSGPAAAATPLSLDRPDELVAALSRDNFLWRRHAQRLLVERGKTDVVPALLKLVADQSVDAIGLNVGAIHALWTLHGLHAITLQQPTVFEAVVAALRHPSAGVRRNALQVLPTVPEATAAVLAAKVTTDADPQVTLAAWLALADLPATAESARALVSTPRGKAELLSDRGWTDAITSAAAMHGIGYLEALQAATVEGGKPLASNDPALPIVRRVAEHLARGRLTGPETDRLLKAVTSSPVLLAATLDGLSAGWPRGHEVAIQPATEQLLVAAFPTSTAGVKGQLAKLAPSWGSQALAKFSNEIIASLLQVVRDKQAKDDARIAAATELVAYQPQSDQIVSDVLALITPQVSAEFASRLVSVLSASTAPELGAKLESRLPSMTPAARSATIRVLLARPQTVPAFLSAVESGSLQLADLSLDQKQALSEYPDRKLRDRAQKLLKQLGGLPSPDREKVLQDLAHVAHETGDPALGKEVFKKQCAKCHKHSGEGVAIGPDLTGMAVHPKHELLIHILDPSRSVEGNFRVYTVQTEEGRVLSGMLAGESRTAIELIDTEAKRHAIPREDIEELVGSKKSLMPEGFEKQATPTELRDLLEFLTQRGQFVPLDLAKVATAVSTKGMFINEANDVERLIFPDWSPKTVEGVPFQLVDPQGDRVANVVLLNGPNGTIPPKMPKTVSLPCRMPAKAIHLLSGVGGWAFPFGEKGSVSMIVRLKYADGSTEDHELKNGEQFADYIRVVDVPGSKLAFKLRGQQIRYLNVLPRKPDAIETVELVKGRDGTAPVVMAVTVESR